MTTRINGVTNRDIHNLACAATGVAINRADSTEELQQYLLFGGGAMALPTVFKTGKAIVWDLPKWGYQNYGNYGNAFNTVWNNTIGQTNLYSANRAALKGNFWNTVNHTAKMTQLNQMNIPQFDTKALQTEVRHLQRKANVLKPNQADDALTSLNRTLKRTRNNAAIIKNQNALLKANIYKDVNRLVKEAKGLSGAALKAKLAEIDKAKAAADIAWNNAAKGHTTKIGKAASWVKTKTGLRSAQNAITNATTSSNAVTRTMAKGIKGGGGAMAVIGLACEAPTIVQTYKELGAGKGTKQLAKSATVVAAETVGYVAGAKIGGIAGAKAGAAIGTCIGGPIGTAIGGAVGAIIGVGCGLLGSWLCGKAARAVVGKDELTLAKEKKCEELEKAAKKDAQTQIELAIAARQNLENGNVQSEADAEDIVKSYAKVENGIAQAQITASTGIFGNGAFTGVSSQSTYNNPSYQVDENLQGLFSLANNNYSYNQFNPYTFTNPFMFTNPFGNMNNMFGTGINNIYAFNPINTMQYNNPFGMYNPYMMQFNNPFMMNNLGLVA